LFFHNFKKKDRRPTGLIFFVASDYFYHFEGLNNRFQQFASTYAQIRLFIIIVME